ncbi:MAG: hypothetical protein ACT4R6_06435 [Gemmatimonadaceae bacterium]
MDQWREMRERYPRASVLLIAVVAGLLLGNVFLATRWLRYNSEARRLRAGMSDVEKAKVDVELADRENRVRVMMELARRQALGDRDLHLAVVLDSGLMRLQRSGAVLRAMPVLIGPERALGSAPDDPRIVAPRGERTVARVVSGRQAWGVPHWVFRDRGLGVPNDTVIVGALGSVGLVLSDGSVIYATPQDGPLSDSAYVLPGSVRAERADLRAIAPNLRPGMKVYFYE